MSDETKKEVREPAIADVKVSTAPAFKKGDKVQHVDDPTVAGEVVEVLDRPRGHVVRVSGIGNLVPAESLKKLP